MSELKAFNCVESDVQEFCEPRLAYLKSEVDKVIAELKTENESLLQQNRELCLALQVMYSKEEYDKQKAKADNVIAELKADYKEACDRLQTANLIKDEQLAKLRHYKYKRCLDKAEICCEKKHNCYNRALRKFSQDEVDYLASKSEFWQDWEFIWLKIAEQFKEGV